tara:strand:- start:985 stop:1761 length:777 start_codon:yes stop_codon:yes gene_type:complete
VTSSRAAEITETNVGLCFPHYTPEQRKQLAQESLAETACLLGELGIISRWPESRRLAITPDRIPILEEALESKRGVLILAPHFGNWEFLGLYLGQLGLMALYNQPTNKFLERALLKIREHSSVRLEPLTFAGLRTARTHLGKGGCLGMLPDQVPRRAAGVYAPFFGIDSLTMTLAHRLIQSTNPIVLIGIAKRVPSGFELRFSKPEDGLYSASATLSAESMNRSIEELILVDPAQYQWEYKRFRRQPQGSDCLYAHLG